MSRSFRQKSLTGGLFITDSGIMAATKFTHSDIIHFRCTVNVCFFQTSPPNLCDDVSIYGRTKLQNVKVEIRLDRKHISHF